MPNVYLFYLFFNNIYSKSNALENGKIKDDIKRLLLKFFKILLTLNLITK